MTHPNRRANDAEIEARRRKVASALLAGSDNFTSIAKELGVSHQTIGRDVKAIEAQWQAEAVQDISAAKGRDLRRSERMIGAMWPKALGGDERAAKMVLDLMQHRAKLLGLNAAEPKSTVDVTHSGTIKHAHHDMSQFTDEEIDTLAEIARRQKVAQ